MGTVTVRVTDSTGGAGQATAAYAVGASMLIGSSNVDNATELNAYLNRFGVLRVRRSYDQPGTGVPATWTQSAAAMDVGVRASVYSFKPDVASYAAGQLDARTAGFLDSVPVDGFRKYLVLWHEPESELKAGAFTPAQFRAATLRFHNLVLATGRGDLLAMVCFAGIQCFDGQTLRSHGWDADDLVPDGVAVCFDAYNKYPEAGFAWRELEERFAMQVAFAQARGVRWGISETGCYEHPDGVHRKLAWTSAGVDWARTNGAEFFTYWDNAFGSDPNPLLRRLHSSPEHTALWRDLTEA